MISNSVCLCVRERERRPSEAQWHKVQCWCQYGAVLYDYSCDHCRHFTVKVKYSYLLHKPKHSCRYQSLFHVENGEVRIRNDKVCVWEIKCFLSLWVGMRLNCKAGFNWGVRSEDLVRCFCSNNSVISCFVLSEVRHFDLWRARSGLILIHDKYAADDWFIPSVVEGHQWIRPEITTKSIHRFCKRLPQCEVYT